MSTSLGIKSIKFGDSYFRSVVVTDGIGFRLHDGRPVRKIDDSTFEYEGDKDV
jgi:hypothetical protein